MEWVANRYDLEIATLEEKWLKQYPYWTANCRLRKRSSKTKKEKNSNT